MKSEIIEKAKNIINFRKANAEEEAYNNKIKALDDKQFKKLYSDYINAIIDEAKNNTDNHNSNNLNKLCQDRLKQLQIGPITPVYHCTKCNDTGFCDGKYCECLIDEINKILKDESGFLNLVDFKDSNFQLFNAENSDFIKKLYQKMQLWCNSDLNKTVIFLSGQTGVGKTYLIECMANELIKRHKLVLLTTSFSMHQDFIKSYSNRDPEEKQNIISKYLDAEVLFIDDLGTELRQPNITVNYLYQVLNERKINKKPTIITSNLDLSDIMDYYDERISSRIADKSTSICIYIKGDDLRLK